MEVLRASSLILHVGDLTSRSLLDALERLAPVEAIHGNMDEPELRAALPESRVVEAEGLRIGLVHDAGPGGGRHERLLRSFPDCNVVAYGHTHIPEVARKDGVWIVNPGSPTERRRSSDHALAVIRDGIPELVILE